MKYKEIIKKVADELGLSQDIVDKTYKAYWRYIKTHIESIPLQDDITEEQFNQYKSNFNIPLIGKFHCSYEHAQAMKRGYAGSGNKKKVRHAKHKEDKTDIQ